MIKLSKHLKADQVSENGLTMIKGCYIYIIEKIRSIQ